MLEAFFDPLRSKSLSKGSTVKKRNIIINQNIPPKSNFIIF